MVKKLVLIFGFLFLSTFCFFLLKSYWLNQTLQWIDIFAISILGTLLCLLFNWQFNREK